MYTLAYLIPLYIPPPGGETAPGLPTRGLHNSRVYPVGLVYNDPSFTTRTTYWLASTCHSGYLNSHLFKMIHYVMYKEVNRKGSNDPPGRDSSGGILDKVGT